VFKIDPKDFNKIGLNNLARFDTKELSKLSETIKNINVQPNVSNISTFKMDFSSIEEKRRQEAENHENLKRIVAATESIDSKLDHVSNDIEYILHSIGANFQRLERLGIEEKEALNSLLLALQYRNADSKIKIKELLADKGADFLINLFFAYFQLKMTNPNV
jgi:hypothetical protein